ncbi:hypothetical protein OOK31_19915 [Streptomyces sp. NBC_00249]|uniref:hypothetical protein n=1 Tax=Streptomyces sp. NBC_00249 TaxID=2975690 RepID=UPI0022502C23|nr:hypothetical protein [Streptomyces sp. NBC_00249]MCX5196135.1 hypothetical protein [Streptomyces sp. NBC_00249]
MRRTRALLALAALAATAGCADVAGLQNDGDLGTVHAPQTLWKNIRPDPPAPGQQPGTAAPVPGLPKVPSGSDMRTVDALSVVRADITSATTEDNGTGRLVDPRAIQRLALCTRAPAGGPDCPVRPPALHDVTGDGKPELITALDIDGRLSELRVYKITNNGGITRILSRRAVLEGVEVAAEHLAVREPTSNPQYTSVSDYVWDPKAGIMNLSQLTLDECQALTDTPLGPDRTRCAR